MGQLYSAIKKEPYLQNFEPNSFLSFCVLFVFVRGRSNLLCNTSCNAAAANLGQISG